MNEALQDQNKELIDDLERLSRMNKKLEAQYEGMREAIRLKDDKIGEMEVQNQMLSSQFSNAGDIMKMSSNEY